MSFGKQGEPDLGVGTHLGYMPALDGIRAVAIIAVMANHGGLGWASGGLLGVNVFFVLSGFLITQLLLKEWSGSTTIKLGAFWARRARRLLPALFVLLAGIALFAWVFAPSGTQSSILGDGLSTLFYFNNWHQIADGRSYFVQVSGLSPLLHTWTLAIEEQFYLVWPLVVLGVLKLWRSRTVLLVVAVAGALASATAMALFYHAGPDFDPTRLYFGTDTRAQDVLVGAALGILLGGRSPATGRQARQGLSAMVGVAAVVFLWVWSRTAGTSSFPYRGGFFLADITVALVICGVVLAPTGLPARVLSIRPLRFVGLISYGLYLWHWPVDLVLDHARTGLDNYSLFALRSAVALVLATLSYYLVERPIRQMQFGSWRSWAWVPVGAVVVSGLLVASAAGALTAPTQNSTAAQREAFYAFSFPSQPKRTNVLFVGDSLALYVGYGLAPYAARYGVTIGGRAVSGCGLAASVPDDVHGQVNYPIAPCNQWPMWYQADVDQLHPDVVVLIVGWWEALDRVLNGRWQHLGEPEFDAYETSQFDQAVSILGSRGARVALVTAPYFDTGEQLNGQSWDEDDPARVRVLNSIIETVAARHPGVAVVPLNRYLDPNGHFTWTIDGTTVRLGDGIHTTPAAGGYLAPKMLPQLAGLGHR